MSLSLTELIRETIAKRGPIDVGEYMTLALSHPDFGYYMQKDPLGAKGDFITAPEISQVFGELLAAWIAIQWQAMGNPEVTLLELGPGRGTLMHDILRASRHVQGFHDSLHIVLVETSPTLKQKQWKMLAGKHPRLDWQESVDALPARPLLAIANEFFDALPIRQFVHSKGTWQERAVSLDAKDQLHFTLQPATPPPAFPVKQPTDDTIYEYSEGSLQVMKRLAKHIAKHGGAGLIIDYGYEGGTRGDTLQAVKAHEFHEVLKDPGSADLTAHVDFDTLAAVASKTGAATYGPRPQGAFLGTLGAVPRAMRLCEGNSPELQASIMSGVERLLSPDQMGERFKVLAITAPAHPKPEGF